MKISSKLPQFRGASALLVVAGKQAAEFYVAEDADIVRVATVAIPTPRYSNREAFSVRRSRGRVLAAGAGREERGRAVRRQFLRELKAKTAGLVGSRAVTATYLYAPAYLMTELKAALAKVIGETYVMSFRGNYHGRHPFDLLEMIAARRIRRSSKRLVVPTKREAVNLLKRGRQQ